MKKLLVHLSILSLLAVLAAPMIACQKAADDTGGAGQAPAATGESSAAGDEGMEQAGDEMGDESGEMGEGSDEEMGEEMKEGDDQGAQEGEEMGQGEEGAAPPPQS
jgi:hypothetical protein